MLNEIHCMDAGAGVALLGDASVNMCVTSPPYFRLRDYGVDGQIGLENSPEEYIGRLVEVFRGVRRVLRDDGTLWVNIGDSYSNEGKHGGISGGIRQGALHGGGRTREKYSSGLKQKDLIGIPWMLAFALRADGWYLRQDIVWHKPNPMPESVTDRCTKAHEYIFLLSKSPKYYFDYKAIRTSSKGWNGSTFDGGKTFDHHNQVNKESKKPRFGGGKYPGNGSDGPYSGNEYVDNGFANKRSVWSVPLKPYYGAHFATFPVKLIEPCILAGCQEGGVVLDPFMGSGVTAIAARMLGRNFIGFELNSEYIKFAQQRMAAELGVFNL